MVAQIEDWEELLPLKLMLCLLLQALGLKLHKNNVF